MGCGCRKNTSAVKRTVTAAAQASQNQEQPPIRPSRWSGKRVIERKGAADDK